MKLILMAAMLTTAPALAQTTAPTDGAASGQSVPNGQPMPNADHGGQIQPGGTPIGGYQPAGPALSGTPTAGAPVTFQAAQSPAQAYPAPAPLDHYPPCKPGQFDKCMQTGGSHASGHKMIKGHRMMKRHAMAHHTMPMKKAATAPSQ